MITEKAYIICLLDILEEYSDAEHIMQMKDIIGKMYALYGVKIDRRTVYSCFDTLCRLGYDISMYEENGSGYFLRGREFDPSEIRLLMDSVYTNNAIPAKPSARLIEKLQKLMSVHKRKHYRSLTICREGGKSPNQETFYNIGVIDDAIAGHRRISFHYLRYDFDKKLKPKSEQKYVVSPFGMAVHSNSYYLVGFCHRRQEIRHYHLSKIQGISMLEEAAAPLPENFRLDAYMQKAVFMYGGQPQIIRMRCRNQILDNVITRFGNDVQIERIDAEHFLASVEANPAGMYVWALHFLDACEVLEPADLREQICSAVRNCAYFQ